MIVVRSELLKNSSMMRVNLAIISHNQDTIKYNEGAKFHIRYDGSMKTYGSLLLGIYYSRTKGKNDISTKCRNARAVEV